jgi:hypothetical protein
MRWCVATVGAALLAQGEADYQSAKRKLELIQSEHLPLGTYVALRPRELTAYAQREVRKVVPEGVRQPRVQLGDGEATAFAYLDFPKLRRSTGKPLGWLMARLLAGERPVRVKARVLSSGGQARVDLERVEIGGLAVGGAALEFLIGNFVLPYYPDAMIGRPFELAYGIERLEVRPTEVRVVIGR